MSGRDEDAGDFGREIEVGWFPQVLTGGSCAEMGLIILVCLPRGGDDGAGRDRERKEVRWAADEEGSDAAAV